MTEDFNAGRLYVDAYVDTKGASRGLQTRLDAQTKDLRAKIRAEIDTRGTIASARKAAKEASDAARVKIKAELDSRGLQKAAREAAAGVKVKVKAELDARGLIKSTREAAAAASAAAKVKIKVEIDAASERAVQRQIAALGTAGRDVKVGVDADTGAADAEIDSMRAKQSNNPIKIPVKADASGLSGIGTTLMQVGKIPALVGGFYTLGAAIVQVGGGLFSMASAAVQASGALAVLPNLIGVAAQGIAVLMAGFRGVGDAVKAMAAKQAAATTETQKQGKAARQNAAQQKASAQAIKAAQQQVGDAYLARRKAVISLRDAEKDMALAVENAKENLRDLRMELSGAKNDEEAAANAVAKARMDLQDVNWNAAASPQERREAQAALDEAVGSLEDAKNKRLDIADDLQRAEKKGIKGDPGVVQAQRKIRDAKMSVADADRQIARAEQGVRDARAQGAAQQAAYADSLDNMSASSVKLNTAMDNLSPAGQRFATFIFKTLMPRLKSLRFAIQEALLPPVQRGIEAAMPLLDTLQVGLVDTAKRIGAFAERLGKSMGSKAFNNDVSKIMGSNNRALSSFGDAAFNLIQILRHLAVVAGPILLEPFAKWTKALSENALEQTKAGRKSGGLAAFLKRAGDRAAQLARIFRNLSKALFGVGKAAIKGSGNDLMATFEKTTKRWSDMANSPDGQKAMQDFFKATGPPLKALGRLLTAMGKFLALAGGGDNTAVVGFLDTLTAMFEGLNRLMEIPGMADFVGQVMLLAGTAGALSVVAGAILKMSSGLGKIAKVTGLAKVGKALNNIGSGGGAGPTVGGRIKSAAAKPFKAAGRGVKKVATRAGRAVGGAARKGVARVAAKVTRQGAQVAGDTLMGKVQEKAAQAASAVAKRVGGAARTAGNSAAAFSKKWAKVGWGKITQGAKTAGGGLARLASATGRAAAQAGRFAAQQATRGVKAFVSIAKTAGAAAVQLGRLALGYIKVGIQAGISAVRQGAARLATLLIAGATKAFAIAQGILNAVLRMNPIILIVSLLILLGVALVALYRKNETFRRIVNKVWASIKSAISFAWNKVIKPAFNGIKSGLSALGRTAQWLWRNAIGPAWRLIQKAVSLAWNYYYKPILRAIWGALRFLGSVFTWLWRKAIQPAWSKIQSAISWAWKKVISPVFTAFKNGIHKVAGAFDAAQKAIGKAWAKIRSAVEKPIHAVISLINAHIISPFNTVSGKLGGPHINGIPNKFSQGGRVGGHSPTSTADNIPALLTAKEHVTRVKSAERMRRENPGVLDYINKFGRLPDAYAAGGRVLAAGASRLASGVQRLAKGGVVWPTIGRKTTTYPGHDGVDINQPPGPDFGAPIFAYRSGRISYVGSGRGYGVPAIFERPDVGPEVVYGHTSRAVVHAGQSVRAGQTIGYVGSTGNSTGPHLHFGPPGGTTAGALALLRGASTAPGGGGGGGGFSAPSFISTLGSKIGAAVRGGASWFTDKAKGALSAFSDKFGKNAMGKMLAGVPKKLIGAAGAKVKSLFTGAEAKYNKRNVGAASLNAAMNFTGKGGHLSPSAARGAGQKMMPKGWSFGALNNLWNRESGWRWNADNPGSSAYGIPQSLPGSKMASAGKDWRDNALTQIKWGLGYIKERYGDSGAAWAHSQRLGWYDRGGALYPGSTFAYNGTGKIETIFTNENMVAMTRNLSQVAKTILGDTTEGTVNGGPAPLVGSLSVTAMPGDMPGALRDVDSALRHIQMGGVHADRIAQAPVRTP